MSLSHRLHTWKWWCYHRFVPRHRYNIVRTGLEPGYYDEDDLILHACFSLLERFCHNWGWVGQAEQYALDSAGSKDYMPAENWNRCYEEHYRFAKAVTDLSNYWFVRKNPDTVYSLVEGNTIHDLDDVMLHKLISIRQELWD